MALTPKQKRFVAEYLVDLNATAAARRAGYSAKTADRIGPELLGKTCVSEAIQQAIREREKRTEITQDMVLRETAKLAFFDIRNIFDKDGKPLDISKLDADTAAALEGLAGEQSGGSPQGYDRPGREPVCLPGRFHRGYLHQADQSGGFLRSLPDLPYCPGDSGCRYHQRACGDHHRHGYRTVSPDPAELRPGDRLRPPDNALNSINGTAPAGGETA